METATMMLATAATQHDVIICVVPSFQLPVGAELQVKNCIKHARLDACNSFLQLSSYQFMKGSSWSKWVSWNYAETALKSWVPMVPSLYCPWNDSTQHATCEIHNMRHTFWTVLWDAELEELLEKWETRSNADTIRTTTVGSYRSAGGFQYQRVGG